VSATPNTEIVRDLITHFFNAHDVEVAERYFAPDLKWHGGLVVEGTHEGELWGLPPTGRRVRWDATTIYRIRDGKVVEQWAAEDWTAIVHAVGDYTPPWLRT
jgi:predicted ester cyclase